MKRLLPFLCLCAVAALWLAAATSSARAEVVGGWPVGTPPPFVQGTTLAASVLNAAQLTSDQARVTADAAVQMGRRARGAAYLMQNFSTDYQNLQYQFQNLRATFNMLADWVAQLQSARAANAVAELDAGLGIISEVFAPVQQELEAGTVNRNTVIRMCQLLKETLDLWQRELKKNSSRLGMIR